MEENLKFVDLENGVPEELAGQVGFEEILGKIGHNTEYNIPLSHRETVVLDAIYRYRLGQCLTRGYPLKDVREFLDHLNHVTHPDHERTVSTPYFKRWQAYLDILEDQNVSLTSEIPGQLLKTDKAVQKVWEIFKQLAGPEGLTVFQVRKKSRLSQAQTEQALTLLWVNGLLECVQWEMPGVKPNDNKPRFVPKDPKRQNIRPTFSGKTLW